ncbi:hypothetical protein [Magnetospirillum sp. UT-4]|uniref:hypothetical protein n=1 Tax=Magnetospirillum sp. UT-4 TaxID=2681467 RepID=UPI001382076F|nr:hypothetical protein [Magnetospirillum sp. UT-4]CAA7617628.1 conserved hypothetical protein [Magnetospirillum sp. UT-4]
MSERSRRLPMAPTKLSPQDYARTVGSHLKTREGAVPRIYTDGKGIPTMGTGIALAVSGDGGKTYKLRDLDQIGAEISGDPARPYKFSETEQKLLNDTVGKLNDPNVKAKDRPAEAQKLIPPYKPGKETAADNKFGFTLSDERIARQAESAWNQHRQSAMKAVRDQAKARGWSKERTESYIDALKGSKQEIALTSLAYNGVPAPKATGALLDGDPVTLRKEILYGSNPPSNTTSRTGIADRRKDEADLAAGRFEDWTPEQREQWRQVEADPNVRQYRGTFPATFPQYGPPIPPAGPEPRPQPEPIAGAGEDDLKGGAGNDTLGPDTLGPDTLGTDPQVAAMVEMAGRPVDNPGRSALLKPVERLTQAEMMDMINHAQADYRGYRSGDPLKAHTYERVQDWHVAMYGDAPQGNDGGKPVEPAPIRPIPDRPAPHTTPDGGDLWQATARIGAKVAEAAGSEGYSSAVTGLQRGLNILNQAHPLPKRSPAYGPYSGLGPVDEDGAYGPQTDFALKHATARLGPHKVEEGLALGRFNAFARDARRTGNAEGLEARTHAILGPLFRKDDQGPKVEAGVLQDTLNGFGQDLKVDEWIGPKTTAAFGAVLKDQDPDAVTLAFGRGLGLL